MKKLHLDRNNNIKFLIYFFSLFIFLSIPLSFLYKGKILDFYSRAYSQIFINQNQNTFLQQESENLRNEIQNLRNVILEKNISEDQVSVGIIDKIKAEKINISLFNKNIIYSEILLNKGILSGVETGYIVYVSGFKPIGIITETNENSSKLKLYSDKNFESEFILKSIVGKTEAELNQKNIASTTQGTSSSAILIYEENVNKYKDYTFFGTGDGAYGIKIKIPSSLSVKLLDSVYTKDDTVNPVGEIVSVEDVISQKEKEVYVKTFYNSSINTSFYITK